MKRRKLLFALSFSGLILMIVFQLYQLRNLPVQPHEIATDTMPSFEFEMLDGLPFSNVDLPLDSKVVVFMYMDPTCEDCDKIVAKILRYYQEFKDVELYMITEADKTQVEVFNQKYQLDKYSNIHLLLDKAQMMYKTFGLYSVPSFIVYNAELQKVKVIDDRFNLSIVVKYVRQANKQNGSTNF